MIAQIVDESGDGLEQSRDYVAGARVYSDWINAQGGIGGHRLVLVTRVDGGDAAGARDALREVLDRNNAVALFGFVSELALAALASERELARRGIALVAPLSGLDAAEGDEHTFFLRPSWGDEALFCIDWLRKTSLTRMAIVADASATSRAQREAALRGLAPRGVTLAADVAIGANGADAGAAARRVAAVQPQFVLVLADSVGTAQFVRAWRAIDAGTPLVAMSRVRQQTVLELAGTRAAHGTLLTQVVPDPFKGTSPLARQHLELMKRFRDEPPSHLTFEGFIAAKYLVTVMKSIGGRIDRASVLAALRSRRTVDLAGMVIAWPERGSRGSRFADMTLLRRDGSLLQ